MRNDLFIRVGCFLTGYNYDILKTCTELSKKSVKKYTSALTILILIWSVTGFLFANRYLFRDSPFSFLVSILTGLIFMVIIIQVERQIILDVDNRWPLKLFRILIAIVMALLGSAIMDQMIFKDDIERAKVEINNDEVNRLLPKRIAIIDTTLKDISKDLLKLDLEKERLNSDLSKSPYVKTALTETARRAGKTNSGKDTTFIDKTTSVSEIINPKFAQLESITIQTERLLKRQIEFEDKRLKARDNLQLEIESKVGFLDELEVMFSILGKSVIAFCFYILLFCFLLFLELFIVLSKLLDRENDYIMLIKHQYKERRKSFEELSKRT